MKYGIIYCFYNNDNVIKDIEVIDADSIEDAFDKTNCNLEVNTIIPLNKNNKKLLKELYSLIF